MGRLTRSVGEEEERGERDRQRGRRGDLLKWERCEALPEFGSTDGDPIQGRAV